MGWALDRLRKAHDELNRLLLGALAILGGGASEATVEGRAPTAVPGV